MPSKPNPSQARVPGSGKLLMPAEWEPHEATWLGWPHNASDWPGKIAAIHFVYGEIVRKVTLGEKARIIVEHERHETKARRILEDAGVDMRAVEFFRIPTDRGWTRDFGPIFVRTASVSGHPETRDGIAIAGFRFNAWAKYPDHKKDVKVAEKLARKLRKDYLPVVHNNKKVVLEGGAIDVNGRGTLLTTEECLLDDKVQVRNPGVSRKDYEQIMLESLGATNVIWLNKGIAGDDTHGHVDDLCRFVNENTIVLCRETDPNDANYNLLEENRERLEGAKLENGSKPNVAFLPMPAPLYFRGQRLPASYANFLITNAAVLVPTFNDPRDRDALGILAEFFPDRQVIGIHAVDLVWGLGTLHCLSQQQPI